MLKIKNILLLTFSALLFSVNIASAQVVVTGANNYYGGSGFNPYSIGQETYASNSTQKYPELCQLLNRTLIQGDSGNDVKRLQVVLGQEGIAYLGATGYFGPVTKNAIKTFQLRNGISQTGNVGPITLARMKLLWCGGQSGQVGNNPSGYINSINTNQYNVANNGPLEVSIAPISSSGNNVMLGWNTKYANSCDINGEQVQINGQKIYNIYYEITFTISCYGYNNSRVTKSIVLRPNQSITNLPTVNLSINPTSALVNTYATLFWSSTNTSSCTLNGQGVPVSGSQQILVTNTQTAYQLSCTNYNGQSVSSTVYSNPGATNNLNLSSASISSNISSVSSGQPVTLTWSSVNTSSCAVTGGTSTYTGTNGTQVVYPTQTTVYTVSCYGLTTGPQVTNQVIVNVIGSVNNLPVINSFTSSPNTIVAGQASTLTWSASNATYCKVNGPTINTGNLSINNTLGVTPIQTGTYTLTCTNVNGQDTSATVTVIVNTTNSNVNPTVSIFPTRFDASNPIILSWSSTNAAYCNIKANGVSLFANQQGSGTRTLYPTTTTTYIVNCFTSSGQSSEASVTAILNSSPVPAVSIQAVPTSVSPGQPVTVSWASAGATYCNLTGINNTNNNTSGSVVVNPTVNTTYQVTCGNNTSVYTVSSSASVIVSGSSVGSGSVTISPSSINVGSVGNISWNISTTTSPQGIFLKLYDSNNVFYGDIQRINTYNPVSSYSWTIPKVVFDTSNDGLSCMIVDGQQFCGGSPKKVLSGTYKIRATLFTPSNACFANCQPITGQKILGTYESPSFTINTTSNTGSVIPNLSVNPNNISSGQAVVLTWSATNATYCNILNSTGASVVSNQSTSGNHTVYPTVSGNYQVTCYNSTGQSGNAYSYVTVNGGQTGNVTATISASPNPATNGQPVTLSWSSTNANYCNITANNSAILNNQSTSGTSIVYPSISTNYQINCYNNNGQNGAGYVYVTLSGNTTVTPTANIYASAQNVNSGQSLTLNWYSANANTCSLYGNNNLIISNQNTSGSYLVYPTQTTNYQITCTNNSSGQTANAYVNVTVNGTGSGNNVTLISNYNRQVTVQVTNNTCSANNYVMWGDGQSSIVPTQCGSVTMTHQYPYSGSFNINLWLNGVSGNSLQVYVQ